MIILSLVLGSLVAMGLPIITAVVGLGVALGHRSGSLGHVRDDPVQRPDAGDHDRARGGHRLRAVPDHPAPGAPARRHADPSTRSPARSRPPAARSSSPAARSSSPCSRSGSPASRWSARSAWPPRSRSSPPCSSRSPCSPRSSACSATASPGSSLPAFMRPRSSRRAGLLGPLGRRRTPPPGPGRRALPGGAGAADHPGLHAGARAGGRRRHLAGDDRAPGLRPDHRRVRRRLQRPAPGRVRARPGGRAERTSTPRSTTRRSRCRRDLEQKQKDLPKQQQKLEHSSRAGGRAGSSRPERPAARAEQASLERQGDQLQAAAGASWSGRPRRCRPQQRRLEAEQRKLEAERGALERQARGARREDPAARPRARPARRPRAGPASAGSSVPRAIPTGWPACGPGWPTCASARTQVRRPARPARRSRRAGSPTRPGGCRRRRTQLQQQADRRCSARPTPWSARSPSSSGRPPRSSARPTSCSGRRPRSSARATRCSGRPTRSRQQADELKAEQKQAQQEQKQAEQLKQELTDMVTAGRRRPARHGPARRAPPGRALRPPSGVVVADPAAAQREGRRRPAVGRPGDRAGVRRHRRPGHPRARHRAARTPTRAGGITSYVGGYTASYVDLAVADLGPAAAGDRHRDPARLPAADDRVPLAADPAAGGDHQPPVGRRGVRRADRRVPVGLGDLAARHRHRRRLGPDRELRAADDVRRASSACRWTTRCSSSATSSSTTTPARRRGTPCRPRWRPAPGSRPRPR